MDLIPLKSLHTRTDWKLLQRKAIWLHWDTNWPLPLFPETFFANKNVLLYPELGLEVLHYPRMGFNHSLKKNAPVLETRGECSVPEQI